jgi:hypothetical protein
VSGYALNLQGMITPKKYIFVKLKVQDRDNTYYVCEVYRISAYRSVEHFADEKASKWYDNNKTRDYQKEIMRNESEGVYSYQSELEEIKVKVDKACEITKYEYTILNKFLK